MKGSDIKPGDTVELAHKGTSFFDPRTGFRLSIDGKEKLKAPIGVKTRTALMSGRLLVVAEPKPKAAAPAAATKAPAKQASTEKAGAKEKK